MSRYLLCILIIATSFGYACRSRSPVNQVAQNRNDDPICVRKPDLRLVVATVNDDINAMTEALKAGADVNATVEGLGPPITIAPLNSAQAVGLLLDHGANVNATDVGGSTPLIVACTIDHREIAKLLISRGANVNAVANLKTKDGRTAPFTALTMSKARGHNEMVQLLIDAGAKE